MTQFVRVALKLKPKGMSLKLESLPKARVLVVEGQPLTRIGISTVVQSNPLLEVCGEAGDAVTARQFCVERKPELVILNLTIPRGDGIGLLRDFLRGHPPVRAIVLADCQDALSMRRSLKVGARGYLMKHEELAELETALSEVLAGNIFTSRCAASLLATSYSHGTDSVELRSIESLTDREMSIFRRLGRKQGATEIARELQISIKTIETHQRNIRQKLEMRSGSEVRRAAEQWEISRR